MRPDHTDRNAGIVAMYAEGLSTVVIGQQIGMTDERVRQILKSAGVQMRSRGHRSARLAHEAHDDAAVNDAGAPPAAADAPQAADGLRLSS